MSKLAKLKAKRKEIYGKISSLRDAFNSNGKKWKHADQAKEWEQTNLEYDACIVEIEAESRRPINPLNIGLDDAGGGRVGKRRAPGRGGRGAARSQREYVVDKEGNRHRLLLPRDSMAGEMARCNPELEEQRRNVSLGGYLRGMALGARTVAERNTLVESGGSTGGYTVPRFLAGELIDLLRAKSRVVAAGARTIQMPTAECSFAKLTADPQPTWSMELQENAEVQPTFGLIALTAKTLRMLVTVSRELLEDSINLNSRLPGVFATAMAMEMDRVALIGTGVGAEPLGVLNYSSINTVEMGANGAAPTDYSQVLDAVQGIETANADSPTAAILHPRTKRKYAGLVDTTGQPLLRPQVLDALQFLTTTKLSIAETQGTAVDASSMILGGFQELVLAIRTNITIDLLRERYAESFKYGFLVSLRMDCGAFNEEAFAKIIGITP